MARCGECARRASPARRTGEFAVWLGLLQVHRRITANVEFVFCRRERAAQIPGLTREYVHQLLASDPLHLMTLALTDMSLDFTNRANSMMNGGLYAHRTRMDCALLCYAHQPAQFTEGLPELSAHAAAIRDRNMAHNPLLQRYKTMAERPDPHLGVALLSAEHVAGLLNNHRERSPLGLDGLDIVDARIDLVTVGNELSLNQCPSWRAPFNVNDLVLREGRADGAAAPLPPVAMPDADGHLVQLPDGVAPSLSAETALFPFLFPDGRKFYVHRPHHTFTQYIHHL